MAEQTQRQSAAPFEPLAGIRILDFSRVLAGPLCSQYLADMGADIIKIESGRGGDDTRSWPPFEDGVGTIFLSVNRNKRSLALDLKSPAALELIDKMVLQVDVVLESFGPGVTERLKIDFDRLKAINPRLVYCSVSGYGTRGPMKGNKGYDLIAQAFTGMLSMTGEPEGPPARSPFSPVDQGTGLHAVIGILGAVMQRDRTGAGSKVETSLFDTAVGFLGYFLQSYWQRGTEPVKPGSGHESLCPYQAFDTLDKPLILGVANDALWKSFCHAARRADLAEHPDFARGADRVKNRLATVGMVADIMRTKTRAEWLEVLEERGIPCAPVHTLGELSRHPQTEASDMILPYRNDQGRDLKSVASPVRANGQRLPLRRRPPRLGQHSREILLEFGFDEHQVNALIDERVIFTDPAATATK